MCPQNKKEVVKLKLPITIESNKPKKKFAKYEKKFRV